MIFSNIDLILKTRKKPNSTMSKFFSKIAKIGLWVLVPTLFLSGTKLDNQSSSTILVNGDYTMQITGNLNNKLSGVFDFETAIETTSKGITFSTLKLKLDSRESVLPHSMEFLISKENTTDLLPAGTYKVSGNQEGFLNYFDGVFGFANINALGELPLFAKSGEVQIDYLDNTTVKGTLRLNMSNTIGKSVQIRGSFVATK